ncbi:hypothetical protein CHUAL_003121 [Chamberlinius hualienensis]
MANKHQGIHYCIVVILIFGVTRADYAQEEHGVYYPTECEVCKYTAVEIITRLEETGKSHEVIHSGYNVLDGKKQRKKYKLSETRLIESLEGVCDRLLDYNIHKERTDSTRFARGMSQTFRTLHGLVAKGVKVDLGMPEELWDKPSAEVTMLKTKCESLIEQYEDDIEDWYFNHQDIPLDYYLCSQKALKKGDDDCLVEGNDPKKSKNTVKEEL